MSGTLRISICDPDEKTRDNLKKFLIGMDQIWLEADCSRYEFFTEIVEQTTPDVAIVDWKLPHKFNGMDVIRRLREQKPQMGVVLVSGYPADAIKVQIEDLPKARMLAKPCSIDELVDAVNAVLPEG